MRDAFDDHLYRLPRYLHLLGESDQGNRLSKDGYRCIGHMLDLFTGSTVFPDDPAPDPVPLAGTVSHRREVEEIEEEVFIIQQQECTFWRKTPINRVDRLCCPDNGHRVFTLDTDRSFIAVDGNGSLGFFLQFFLSRAPFAYQDANPVPGNFDLLHHVRSPSLP